MEKLHSHPEPSRSPEARAGSLRLQNPHLHPLQKLPLQPP